MTSYDLIVVGAGPGGSTCAAMAAREGLKVLLLDKDEFPRDKICGDAISGKSVDVMRRLDIIDSLAQHEAQVDCWGITFSGPYGDEASIPFTKDVNRAIAPGYVCDRVTFDNLVLQAAIEAGAEVRTGARVTGLVMDGERATGVTVKKGTSEETIRAPIVVGADGAYSVVVRGLGMDQLNENHYCAGLRWYWSGVTGFNEGNYIEIHFVEEAIPGYFWIFPMADGRANVGVGMRSDYVKKHGIQLKTMLKQMVEHPRFKDRFANATPEESIKGFGLPLGSKPRKMAGNGWMLIGDAASLIDPFSGEGIGNAMVSGELAALWAKKAHEAGDFSGAFLKDYETSTLKYLSNELKVSYALQRLGRWKWLLNMVIGKASRSPEVADAISMMFDDESQRRKLISPMFYLRVLTA
ncbi:geranylgeranyl reductase family protein [soil metagenome]